MTFSGGRALRFFKWFKIHKTIFQINKYLISGLVSSIFEYGVFNLILFSYPFSVTAAHSVSMFTGFLTSFFLNKYWSFQSNGNPFKELLQTAGLFSVNLAFSNAVMFVLTGLLLIPVLISKILVMGLIAGWNFVIFKKWIYR
ncbi:MAG: GtrA family protein [Clostridia bacterium]|nr:GtrA family protein [Clostridia bacterium]